MADTKRNSVAGKVATPKAGASQASQPMLDTMEALGKAIGGRIKVTTAAPHSQTLEGSLFTACPTLNVVAINTRPGAAGPTQPGDYHVIPIARIQNFQITSLPTDGETSIANAQPAIAPVDTKRLKDRETARIAKLKEEEQNRGRGVTKEAQAIFDALKRVNVPIRWHNQEMIVHEAVIIAPPYRPEDCKGSKEKQQVLNQVKKVLEGERRKLKEREAKGAGMGSGPRKGG